MGSALVTRLVSRIDQHFAVVVSAERLSMPKRPHDLLLVCSVAPEGRVVEALVLGALLLVEVSKLLLLHLFHLHLEGLLELSKLNLNVF